jgi:hypothetical protein
MISVTANELGPITGTCAEDPGAWICTIARASEWTNAAAWCDATGMVPGASA